MYKYGLFLLLLSSDFYLQPLAKYTISSHHVLQKCYLLVVFFIVAFGQTQAGVVHMFYPTYLSYESN